MRKNKFFPELFVLPILAVVYFATRLFNILSLPIFTDEAIYTRWAQIARFDPNWRFISLTDGKQPSYIWADMIMMKIIDDPLLAGRVVSVIAGFIVIVGIYFLTREVFSSNDKLKSRTVALIAASLAVLYPFSLVYDRMVLYESLIAAFFVWALYFQILLIRRVRFDLSMLLGFVIGFEVLTKSSGFLSIYLMPVLFFLYDFKQKKQMLLKIVVCLAISAVIANVMYAILRLSPFYHIIDEKNSVFVYPVSEWLKFKFMDKVGNFISNSKGLWDWFSIYFTYPYIFLVLLSFVVSKKYLREKIVLFVWFVLPFLALCVFGKTLYPRYLLFMTMPLIPLVAFSLYSIFTKYKNRLIQIAVVIVILILPIRMFYYVLFDFSKAPIPRSDVEQYSNGWPAGGGVKESIELFKEEAKKGPIYVATQGTFGLMPSAYEIYLYDNKNVTVKGYWPTNDFIPVEVAEIAKTKKTFFVFYQECSLCAFPGDAPDMWPLKSIYTFKKASGVANLTVYEVIPQ